MPQPEKFSFTILALFILAVGLLSFFYPRFFWWLRIGRKAKDIPPVTAYITVLRIGGGLTCVVALYLLYHILFIV